jgi:toxin-antitoxin system PIN domain toxin
LPWPLLPGGAQQGDLPDINVWLALAVQEHPHHAAARRYWDQMQTAAQPGTLPQATLWFCRTTMLGLVRLLCQPKVVGKGALALPAAFALYQQFRSLPSVGLLTEPRGCDAQLQAFVTARAMPARLWTDAWLAALAQTADLRLVTFDKDFLRFNLKSCVVLGV